MDLKLGDDIFFGTADPDLAAKHAHHPLGAANGLQASLDEAADEIKLRLGVLLGEGLPAGKGTSVLAELAENGTVRLYAVVHVCSSSGSLR
jgi:hypothetical protein